MALDIGPLQSGGLDIGPLQSASSVNQTVTGSAGIVSGEAFGTTGTVGQLVGVSGIPSAEAFGTNGTVIGGGNSLAGSAGIASAEAFGTTGAVSTTNSIAGGAGIVSAEAFGTNGIIEQNIVTGLTGIPSAEAFGTTGAVQFGLQGNNGGIKSAEAFGRSGAVLRAQEFTLFIAGLDKTALLKADSMNVTENLATPGTTAQFTLEDPAGSYAPAVGAEVIYYRNAVRHFGGTIEQATTQNWIGSTQNSITVQCADWATILNRHVIGRFYRAIPYGFASTIFADIVQNYLAVDGISYNSIDGDSGIALGDLTFNWVTITEALNQIAKATGWDWRIDYYKVLRQFPSGVGLGAAPFSLADNDGKWRNMQVQPTRGQYRNRQGVRSSQQLIILASDIYSGTQPGPFPQQTQFTNGVQRFFVTSQLFTVAPQVVVNGVNQVVAALDELSTSPGWQWYWIKGGVGVGQNPTAAALTSSDTLTVNYQASPPPIVWAQNDSQIAARAAVEGNSGIYENVFDAPNITDLASAQALAAQLLARYGGGIPTTLTFETDTQVNALAEGLQTGQILTVNTSRPAVSGNFLITQIVLTEVAKQYLRFKVTAVNGTDQRTSFAQEQAAIIARGKQAIPRQVEIGSVPLLPNPPVGPAAPNWTGGAYPFYPYVFRNAGTLRDVTFYFGLRPSTRITGFLSLNGTNIGGFAYPAPTVGSPAGTAGPVSVMFQFSPVRIVISPGDVLIPILDPTDGKNGMMTITVDI